jgi:hypothetical protein
VAGDGERTSVFEVQCERGALTARLSIDPPSGRLETLNLLPAAGNACSP